MGGYYLSLSRHFWATYDIISYRSNIQADLIVINKRDNFPLAQAKKTNYLRLVACCVYIYQVHNELTQLLLDSNLVTLKLYRACSKLICGKGDLCDLLRYLTSIELYENQEFYVFHPYVKEKSYIFKSGNTAFSATSSDSALGERYNRKNSSSRVTVVKQEAIRNATNGTFFLSCVYFPCHQSLE